VIYCICIETIIVLLCQKETVGMFGENTFAIDTPAWHAH